MAALQNWISQAREHWKEFQPARFRSLEATGMLDAALKEAAEQTFLELGQLEDTGFNHHEAWQIVRERHLFPAEENSVDQTLWGHP
jgi:hypothetical protein